MIRNRALSLATKGILAGSAIALATNGLIQVDEVVAPPAVVELPRSAAGGPAFITYQDKWQAWKHITEAEFILLSDSEWKFEAAKPVNLKIKPQRTAFGWYDARVGLQLSADSEVAHWDEQADEEDVVLALALDYFMSDRNVF